MPKTLNMQQGTDAWHEARLGKATASRFKDILSTTKAGTEAAGRKNYRTQLAVERLTGKTPDRFQSKPMEWGQETEELARLRFTMATGKQLDLVGFIEHDELQTGCSPDGMIVGEDAGAEVKCLNSANHIAVLRAGTMPSEYKAQVQGCMWITGKKAWYFASFDPDVPENAQLFVQKIERDETYIASLAQEVARFLGEVDAEVEFIGGWNG